MTICNHMKFEHFTTLPCHTVVFWQLRYLHQQCKSHGALHEARKDCFSCIGHMVRCIGSMWLRFLSSIYFTICIYMYTCNHLHIFAHLWHLRASEEREFYARSLLGAKPVLHEHLARRCSQNRWRQDIARSAWRAAWFRILIDTLFPSWVCRQVSSCVVSRRLCGSFRWVHRCEAKSEIVQKISANLSKSQQIWAKMHVSVAWIVHVVLI